MNRRFKISAVTVTLLLIISLSLNIVLAAGQGAEPGSDQDPIVSKSYVDAAVTQLTAKIQSLLEQNDALKNKLAAQEQNIKTLQEELKAVKAGSSSTGSSSTGSSGGTGNTGNTGTTGGAAGSSIGKATVNTAVLNVRAQANTTSAIAGKVLNGETLTLISKHGDWYKVKTAKGITGFVMAKFVVVKK